MNKLVEGVLKFQREVYPKRRELFRTLAKGQQPEALFIACSDSRVDPNLITQTDPGELFICRNAGNIVPPHTNHTGSMTASIEFALGALQVPHIIVCGHSQCGAMKGAMKPGDLERLPHVKEWLAYARGATLIAEEKGASLPESERLDLLIRENVVMQMVHLRSHPYVASRLAAGTVQIHGWVYDIEHGGVQAYDEAANHFVSVEERYRAEMTGAVPGQTVPQ